MTTVQDLPTQYKELMDRSVQREKKVPSNDYNQSQMQLRKRLDEMDEQTIEAYERYVLAQFRFADQADISKERESAIESLIPGTVNYYHLYFLDLLKEKKSFNEFTQEQKDMYKKFEENHGKESQFYEVEIQLLVVNRLENLPLIKPDSSDADVQQNVDLIDYLYDKFVGRKYKMKKRYEDKTGDTEEEELREIAGEEGLLSKKDEEDIDKVEDYDKQKEEIQAYKRDQCLKEIERQYSDDPHKFKIINGYENEIDWSKWQPMNVWEYAQNFTSIYRLKEMRFQFFRIQNKVFFDKLAEHVSDSEYYRKDANPPSKKKKVIIEMKFLDLFTIEQLQMLKVGVKKHASLGNTPLNQNDMNEDVFLECYYRKYFSQELSLETQASATPQEKLDILGNIKSLITNESPNGFCDILPYLTSEILHLTVKLEQFDEKEFQEYIHCPPIWKQKKGLVCLNDNMVNQNLTFNGKTKIAEEFVKRMISNLEKVEINEAWFLNLLINSIPMSLATTKKYEDNQDRDLIDKYLYHICEKNGSLDAYQNIFKPDYINEIEKKVKIYNSDKGIIDNTLDISPQEFKKIQDEVFINFRGCNKEVFEKDEDVILELSIKNVPELLIKIFEFNTETYYKKTKSPFDTSINLDGMIPAIQRLETEKLIDTPKNKITKHSFTFDELKGKFGLFIIELSGNGVVSRAIIKKGSLTLIHQSTVAGHVGFIIDSERQICKSAKTGVWIDEKFYKADEEKGHIVIPFGKKIENVKTVMIHQNFAQLGQFYRNTETYSFLAKFHINSEQILVGQEASILIKPSLKINGRQADLKFLKDSKIKLTITDYIKKQDISREYTNLKFTNDQEAIITFQVPANMEKINIELDAQVYNVTMNKIQDLEKQKQTFEIRTDLNEAKHNINGKHPRVCTMFNRKIGKDYYVYILGKNGEPIQNVSLDVFYAYNNGIEKPLNDWEKDKYSERKRVEAIDSDFKDDKYSVCTDIRKKKNQFPDEEGKVKIGELNNVRKVQLVANGRGIDDGQILDYKELENFYPVQQDRDDWTVSQDMHFIEGQKIQIPINFVNCDLNTPQQHQVSLVMKRSCQILHNCYDKVKIEKAKSGKYYFLVLENLENGVYNLEYNFWAGQNKKTKITVHKGQYWEGDFILKQNQIFKSSTVKRNLLIDEVDFQNNQNLSQITINLYNFTKDTRVHLYANQFQQKYPKSLKSTLEEGIKNDVQLTRFGFAMWKNMFQQNKTIGDEIKYVFDRQRQENQLGNNIDRPSLLMGKTYVKNTFTKEQILASGGAYEQIQANDLQEQAVRQVGRKGNQKLSDKNQFVNPIKEQQNFLALGPIQHFNLKPNDQGQVIIDVEDLQNYSQLFIVGCNEDSVVQRQIDLGDKFTTTNIQKKELVYSPKKQQNAEMGLQETRESENVYQGQTVNIDDFSSSKIAIIDSCEQIQKVIKELQSASIESSYGSFGQDFEQLTENLLEWETYEQKKKLQLYSKNTCHELNYFLYKRDAPFFNQFVKIFIKNKMEKTFIDWFLLDIDSSNSTTYTRKILTYLEDQMDGLQSLNAFETCLLLEIVLKKGDQNQINRAKNLSQSIINDHTRVEKQRSPSLKSKVFDLVLSLSDLDKEKNIEETLTALGHLECREFVALNQSSSECDEDYLISQDENEFNDCAYDQPTEPASPKMMRQSNTPMRMMKQKKVAMIQQIHRQSNFMSFSDQAPVPSNLFSRINLDEERKKQQREIGFQALEKTAEYQETHYFESQIGNEHYRMNSFFKDYILHLLSNSTTPGQSGKSFLSGDFVDINQKLLPIAFSMLDIPISSPKQSVNKFKSDGKRGINIEAGSNFVFFKRVIKDGQCHLKNDLLVTHRYQDDQKKIDDDEFYGRGGNGGGGGYYDSEDDHSQSYEGGEPEIVIEGLDEQKFYKHKIYKCTIAITNISPKKRQCTLLYQVPNGSIPMKTTKYINSEELTINPFTSKQVFIQFYFPQIGEFEHQPSNISDGDFVIAKSQLHKIRVIQNDKKQIEVVKTFQDMMDLAENNDQRKKMVLELFKDNIQKLHDHQFKFKPQDVKYFCQTDADFMVKLFKIISENPLLEAQFVKTFGCVNPQVLLQPEVKEHRQFIVEIIKSYMLRLKVNKLTQYIFRPVNSQLLNYAHHELFDKDNKHLEYYPIVNQRVFSVGQQDSANDNKQGKKEILNREFKRTYIETLHLALHQAFGQDSGKLEFKEKQKIQLAYYLQLQDRISEAIQVFETIDITKVQINGNKRSLQVQYDYMTAYFDFYTHSSDLDFTKANQIVQKYENYTNKAFRQMFDKIKSKLQEVDIMKAARAAPQDQLPSFETIPNTNSNKKSSMIQPRPRDITSQINKIMLDQNSGQISIDCQNISKFIVKYYLIDAEILFSKSPFVKDQTEQFSYVMPFKTVVQQANLNGDTRINLPEDLQRKNLVIEINSDDIQKFKTFFQSELKVQINQNFGELKVLHKVSMKPLAKTYVKVFTKNNSGQEMFYRDGFTDIRGKFEYAISSGKSIDDIKRFAILVSHDEYGQIIKEANPPKK